MNTKLYTIFASLMILCLLLAACGGAPVATLEPSATPRPATHESSATPRPATLAATNVQPTLNPTSIPATNNILTIGAGWQDPWVRNFNPFYYQSISYPTHCIYEPLMVYNSKTGELVPWLATGYQWGVNSQSLTFTLRKGVQWSDGEPFSSEDVVFTFKMLRDHPDISGYPDIPGIGSYQNPISTLMSETIADVSAPDAFTVVFRFKVVNTLTIYQLAKEIIVPKHIWGQLDRPQDFANPDPVGTGPFTQVTVFEDKLAGFERILQLERNPHYWQPGKPYIQGVKFSFRHEENILEDLAQGKLDMTSIDIPDLHKDFLDLDPSHYQALLVTRSMSLLQLNTTRPPFDNPDVRKAISMGIDRQHIIDTVFQGSIDPANATGLGDQYKSWWNDQAIQSGTWVGSNVSQANAQLDDLGFKKGADGVRITPAGQPMQYTLIADSSDPQQAAVAQAISLGLANIGVALTVKPIDNWWVTFQSGDYDMTLLWSFGIGDTPYEFYYNLMSPAGVPISQAKTNQEAGRYTSAEAGRLLDEFTQVSDPLQQKAIMDQVQTIFVADAPMIPLYPSFGFYEYNTWRFTGFPSTEDPYADGSPWNILVLLNIRPR